MKRLVVLLLFLGGCTAKLTGGSPPKDETPGPGGGPGGQPASYPNIIIAITDDQRYDQMRQERTDIMPRTKAAILDKGVVFDQGYITTPICCPSRASIFTGKYARHHGVMQNHIGLDEATLAQRLHEAGFATALFGKYLNSWPPNQPRPEWDLWVNLRNGAFYDRVINVNGTDLTAKGYYVPFLRQHALSFVEENAGRKPFFMVLAFISPHAPATPAPGDENLYKGFRPQRPPSFDEEDVSDKPRWLQAFPRLRAGDLEDIDQRRLDMLRSLKPLDETIGDVLAAVEAKGELDDTIVFFLSDNGYLLGEHRLGHKTRAYEETSHVPFAVRYSKRFAPKTIPTGLVANIDIAPTIYELAGLEPEPGMDGRSLVSLIEAAGSWREDLLLEGWPDDDKSPPWAAVHTGRYVYIESDGDRNELYDLEQDPYQLESKVGDNGYADVLADMKRRLASYD